MTRYRTLVADPPWPVRGHTWAKERADTARGNKGRPQGQYQTMSLDDICALTPPLADQAHGYIWAVANHVDWAYSVARAWGLEPVILWTWRKPGRGVGRFACNTEYVLVGRRGSRHGNPFGNTAEKYRSAVPGTCFDWPRGKHSEKPDQFFGLVESLSPGPRLELFARKPRLGWDVWGNEVTVALALNAILQGKAGSP